MGQIRTPWGEIALGHFKGNSTQRTTKGTRYPQKKEAGGRPESETKEDNQKKT